MARKLPPKRTAPDKKRAMSGVRDKRERAEWMVRGESHGAASEVRTVDPAEIDLSQYVDKDETKK